MEIKLKDLKNSTLDRHPTIKYILGYGETNITI
jgi:hypothetical protein